VESLGHCGSDYPRDISGSQEGIKEGSVNSEIQSTTCPDTQRFGAPRTRSGLAILGNEHILIRPANNEELSANSTLQCDILTWILRENKNLLIFG
jgi:hypothetical protein